jgi:hypothetical protein
MDNLRFALTILVIFHHTAIAYGGEGNWPYKSCHHSRSMVLLAANGLAQSFFMGTFFFMSGIFSRMALLRKGPKEFVKDKLLRLALPALVYTLAAEPIQNATLELLLHGRTPSFADIGSHFRTFQSSPGIKGPVWYLALLCTFDFLYATAVTLHVIARALQGTTNHQGAAFDPAGKMHMTRLIENFGTCACILGIFVCGIVSFLVRLYIPTTYEFRLLNLRVAYVPQYICLYVLGLNIEPNRINLLPGQSAQFIVAVIVGAIALFIGWGDSGRRHLALTDFSGGLNSAAAAYAILNEFVGYIILATAYHKFRRRCNASWGALTNLSYTIFLVHAPISVAVEAAVNDWVVGGVTKTIVIGIANSICSAIAGWLLRQLPGMAKIL